MSSRPWFGVVFMADEESTGLKVGDHVLVGRAFGKQGRPYDGDEDWEVHLNRRGEGVMLWAGAWTTVSKWDMVVFCHSSWLLAKIGDSPKCSANPTDQWEPVQPQLPERNCIRASGPTIITGMGESRKETTTETGIHIAAKSVPEPWKFSEAPRVRTVLEAGPRAEGVNRGDTVYLWSAVPEAETMEYEIHNISRVVGTLTEYREKEH